MKKTKTFNSVEFFREIKMKLAGNMAGMTLDQKKEFMKKVREGKINIA